MLQPPMVVLSVIVRQRTFDNVFICEHDAVFHIQLPLLFAFLPMVAIWPTKDLEQLFCTSMVHFRRDTPTTVVGLPVLVIFRQCRLTTPSNCDDAFIRNAGHHTTIASITHHLPVQLWVRLTIGGPPYEMFKFFVCHAKIVAVRLHHFTMNGDICDAPWVQL